MPIVLGKGAKTNVVALRLEPKLRYALNLLARKRHRSMTSVIEYALQRAIEDELDGLYKKDPETGQNVEMLEMIWDPDVPDRFVKLALHWPALLKFEEEKLWKAIKENKSLYNRNSPNIQEIRSKWKTLIAEHGAPEV